MIKNRSKAQGENSKRTEGVNRKEIKWLVGLQETDRLFICNIVSYWLYEYIQDFICPFYFSLPNYNTNLRVIGLVYNQLFQGLGVKYEYW